MAAAGTQAFSMPMYKDWFPVRLRPWCYLVMILIFQLSAGVYLGNVSLMVGEGSLLREDVMFIGMCTIVGANMPFPFLFKFKFRYSNNRLLLLATTMMLLCNVACMYVRSVPLLCVLAFVEGFFKPCGTFECFSNVQLWITRSRDMRTFFPVLYFFIAGTMSLQAWLCVQVAYLFEGWRMMHWCIILLLLLCLLFQFLCLQRYYIMRLTMKSVDWLGLLLWSALFCGIVWLCTYGEYYNWAQSKTWREACMMVVVVVLLTIGRMTRIRHPYIAPSIFKVKRLYPILLMFLMGEWFSSTPKVLGTTYITAVLHWGSVAASVLDLYVWLGVVVGSLFAFLWMRVWQRSYMQLGMIAFAVLLLYQVLMYFLVGPATDMSSLRLPMLLRGIGYVIVLIVATIQLYETYGFQTFFMALAFAGIVRNGPADSLVNGIYEFFLRRQERAALATGLVGDGGDALLIALKEVFGATCLIGSAFLLVLLLVAAPPVRSSLQKLPSWHAVGKRLRR